MNEISFQIKLDCSYSEALEKVTAALKAEGFGVLTKIDVKATLKEKINQDFREYAILGACNPPLAYKALRSEPLVGLMLPCNVTVEAVDGGALVNMVNPKAMLLSNSTLAENSVMAEVAADAHQRFQKVAESLSNG